MNYTAHPRPQLERAQWRSLDGPWEFAFDDDAVWTQPRAVVFDLEIQVPFPPESQASGLHNENFHRAVWYRRRLTLAATERPQLGSRLLLHFGAVDYEARVWVNGQRVATHQGGHTAFSADITDAIDGDTLEIVVQACDDPHDLEKPRGKQDWMLEPHVIWYPRTTGIWQTVWLEVVPETYVARLRWTADVSQWQLKLEAQIAGPIQADHHLRLRFSVQGRTLAEDSYALSEPQLHRTIALPDPGIDDMRAEWLWSPEHPQLIAVELELWRAETPIDKVSSYTALRQVDVRDGHFLLNTRPYYLRMALDQGYWPDSLLAARDEDLRRDVELSKALGLNGVRKHQKIEQPRWLYWCDVLGLMVWAEMPSAYSFSSTAMQRLTHEWLEVLGRDASHPCIVAWVPFNESWGLPDLPTSQPQRAYMQALAHLTRAFDPSRALSGNDGWEQLETDILAIHDYTDNPQTLLERYGDSAAIERTVQAVKPALRAITLEGYQANGQAAMLTEFGGIAYSPSSDGWGYSRARRPEDFLALYQNMLAAVLASTGLAGFCYTQLTDTFQEKNGLLYMDRQPKAPLSEMARATLGAQAVHDFERNPLGYSSRWLRKHPAAAFELNLALGFVSGDQT